MTNYDRLTYKTNNEANKYNWLGNLRWFVYEYENGKLAFRCISALPQMSHEECAAIEMQKELVRVAIEPAKNSERVFGVDYFVTNNCKLYMPFYEYGALLDASDSVKIDYDGTAYIEQECAVIETGAYYVAIKADKPPVINNDSISVCAGWMAFEYGTDKQKVIADCKKLLKNRDKVISENKKFWNDYLDSCPIVEMDSKFTYKHDNYNVDECFMPDDFVARQLWHYSCMLQNVSEVEFNKFPLYMAPDKINWLGTWSNDGPQCMAALSLTNQKELSKRLIVSYITNSLTDKGEFSWYMHADGVGCFGTKGDVGRLSHGAPYLPQTVEYYIRNTGDLSILSEDAGGLTVYEKLKSYILNLHTLRDINNDFLIEWANLWETGWDDKGGTFFSSASLEEWMEAVSSGTEDEIDEFYKNNQHPVIAIVEQVISLWAFKAMSKLSELKNDGELKNYCDSMYLSMKKAVSDKCWNEEDGFYYDIDVNSGTQTKEKSADAFYWMNFEEDSSRNKQLFEHLTDENEFNCYYIPMLSKDSKGFNRYGYWSGGHWPREMSFIAMGLKNAGYKEKAFELLVRAVMCDEGNIISEVKEPLKGKSSTKITKMACSIMDVVALLDISGKVKWSD